MGTREELEEFVSFANSLIPSTNVTEDYDYAARSVNYLDMQVFIDKDGYVQ